eukprot:TRINITY_DN2612_c0_g2_i1.p1 TRINITY_DN2612_c0_g2~~TRINITY_DN2612_c0_g2_i1.p1  ORF type:complete len:538 (-),score=101.96 TRINITY_DN2612_c0_g2_i1:107-1720(-)
MMKIALLFTIGCLVLLSQHAHTLSIPFSLLKQQKDVESLSKLILNHAHLFNLKTQNADPPCPLQPTPVPLPNPLPQNITDAFKELDQFLTDYWESLNLPGGLSAAVVYDQDILHTFNFGYKNKSEPSIPPTIDTIYRIGSVSKVFSAIMLYQLLEQGLIKSIDDEVENYWEGFSIINPFSNSGITFRQIVSQLAGLPRESECPNDCQITSEEMLPIIANISLILPPYKIPSYSNLGFALLGNLNAENLKGVSFGDYVENEIIYPLNLTSTGLNFTDSVIAQTAVGYDSNGNPQPLNYYGWMSPAGQIYSTVRDLAKIASSIFCDNSSVSACTPILNGSWATEFTLPVYLNPDGVTLFGTPWEIRFQNSYLVRRKGGNVPGYSALLAVIPELKLSLVSLFSNSISEFDVSDYAFPILIPAFVSVLQSLQPPVPAIPNPELYIGTYYLQNTTTPIAVIEKYSGQYGNLLLFNIIGYNAFFYYESATVMSVYIPPGIISCLDNELLALQYQKFYFVIEKEEVVSFTVNGFVPGVVFVKAK